MKLDELGKLARRGIDWLREPRLVQPEWTDTQRSAAVDWAMSLGNCLCENRYNEEEKEARGWER